MITGPGADKDGTHKDGTHKDGTHEDGAHEDGANQDGPNKHGGNKDLVRAFITAWNDRDFGRFDDLMGAGAVLHVGDAAVSCDPAGTRAIAEQWTTAFPDWRFDLLSLVAEGDRVAAHLPYSGTFTKPILGVAPTGRFARVDEMVIFRIAGGRIAEAWEVYDECGMWRQLGASPPR